MGNGLACTCQQCQPAEEATYVGESPALDAVVLKVDETSKDTVEDFRDAGEDAKYQDVSEVKVEEDEGNLEAKVNEMNDSVDAKEEENKDAVEPRIEEILDVVEKPPQLVVMFDDLKGVSQTATFTYKPLGFEFDKTASNCFCQRQPKSPVKVIKVVPDGQAAKLGMQRGVFICQLNGKDIAGLKQMRELLEQHLTTLPDVSAYN